MHKGLLITAAVMGAIGVIAGAFGAHALKNILPEQSLASYETAVRYQFYHVFALALTGILYQYFSNTLISNAGTMFVLGIIFFSGSLYLLTWLTGAGITGFRWIGAVTPLGGVLLIIGWVLLALGIRKG